jgi:hypothetical protein
MKELPENILEYLRERIEKEYWIDCFGKIHKYEGELNENLFSLHNEIAEKFYPKSTDPMDILLRLGWIRIGSVADSSKVKISKLPTQAQINTLDKLGIYEYLTIGD